MIEEFQRKTIYEKVSEAGWNICVFDALGHTIWLSESWMLESQWSPVGKIVYIWFVIDPMNYDVVFEINATLEPPRDGYGNQPACQMLMKHNWEADLPKFIKCLAQLRDN